MQPSNSEQISTWGSRPPATDDEAKEAVRVLTIAFPKMLPDFWTMLTNRFKALGFPRERLQYILHIAIDTDALINQYRYGNLCIADFTSITKPLDTFGYQEAIEMKENGKEDLVWINFGTKQAKITTKDAAVFACLPYTKF